jgi:hypothetical protein
MERAKHFLRAPDRRLCTKAVQHEASLPSTVMSTPSPLVDAFLQALKDCEVNGKSRAPMKESMKNFLSSQKE